MYDAITVCILGDDGKDDGLNIEDYDEQSADNSIKLTGKGSSSPSILPSKV